MKWIKASDRVPEDWAGVVIRNWVGTKLIVSPFMVTMGGIRVPPQYDFIWRWDGFEWLDESTTDLDQIISEVEDMHPYKVSGKHETYDRYNEAWADACAVLADRIKEALK